MSDDDPHASASTAVLLPTASVAVFSARPEMLEVARALKNDWRFARVDVQAHEGDADTAIEMYKRYASPDLLMVQTETIDEAFTDKLGKLAEYCEARTAAIVVGPVNDVALYRRLVGMGISDYLVHPVELGVLSEVIAKSLLTRLGVMDSRLAVVVGTKGGVGASSIAQGLAWAASEVMGQKTLLLDVAGGWSTLGVGMGFDPSTTLAEAARAANKKSVEDFGRMLFSASDTLKVLASGGDVMLERPISHAQMESILDIALVQFPLVILDLSAAAITLRQKALVRANTIFMVSTPTLPALRLGRTLIQEISSLRSDVSTALRFIMNMQGRNAASEVPPKDVKEALDVAPAATVSFLPKLFMGCESEGQKLLDLRDGEAITRETFVPLLRGSVLGHVIESKADKGEGAKKKGGGFLGGLFGGGK
jgi:pilus assembly protein CpaE